MKPTCNPRKCSASPATSAAGSQTNRGRPKQDQLRAAVNRTYYAMFHTLAITAANAAAGTSARRRREPAWRQTARALNHRTAKQECDRIVGQGLLSPGARRFAQTFSRMQGRRHDADYDDYARFTRAQVQTWIAQAEQAINTLENEPQDTQKAIAAMAMHSRRAA